MEWQIRVWAAVRPRNAEGRANYPIRGCSTISGTLTSPARMVPIWRRLRYLLGWSTKVGLLLKKGQEAGDSRLLQGTLQERLPSGVGVQLQQLLGVHLLPPLNRNPPHPHHVGLRVIGDGEEVLLALQVAGDGGILLGGPFHKPRTPYPEVEEDGASVVGACQGLEGVLGEAVVDLRGSLAPEDEATASSLGLRAGTSSGVAKAVTWSWRRPSRSK